MKRSGEGHDHRSGRLRPLPDDPPLLGAGLLSPLPAGSDVAPPEHLPHSPVREAVPPLVGVAVTGAPTDTLRDRLEAYRALLRREGDVPELGRLVDLLESELRRSDEGPEAAAERRAR